mgnify:CR=1 FL=1|jgi:hypothetical protein|tara:strand:- start:4723 stop:4959 length:237 start_codon:yes stop_codon:yes gene_type:complete
MTRTDDLIHRDIDMNGVLYSINYELDMNRVYIMNVEEITNPFKGTEEDMTYKEGELWGYLTEHLLEYHYTLDNFGWND